MTDFYDILEELILRNGDSLKKLTCAKYLKELGLDGTGELSKITGRGRSTLEGWFENDRKFFNLLALGAIFEKNFMKIIDKIDDGESDD